jgi:hypothetical protein
MSELSIWRNSALKLALEQINDLRYGRTGEGDRRLAVFGDPGYIHALGVIAPIQNAEEWYEILYNKLVSHFRVHVERSYQRFKVFQGLLH